jgi:predicted aminopeptidase
MRTRSRKKPLALAALAVAGLGGGLLLLVGGCSNMGYYAQSISGHLDLVHRAKPVPQWLAADDTPEALKERLKLSQRMRDFAVQRLHLPDNDSYRQYADLGRSSAVWNVVAAPPLSLKLQRWCFPVMGCVGYRGYFHQDEAEAFAAQLRREQPGVEVTVYGVPAYSTLGRLPGGLSSDPLLNTFIRYGEGDLARMIFHELTHQVVYADNDTMFNESFATAVERLGSEMWLAQEGTPQAVLDYRRSNARREDFRTLTARYRDRLQAVYASPGSDEQKLADKAAVMAAMRDDYEQLKREGWGGYAGYDGWFARANNASMGLLSAYNELVPQFEQLFEQQGRDFPRFYAEVRRIAVLPSAERRAALAAGARMP